MKSKIVVFAIFSLLCVTSFAAPAKGAKLVTTQDSLSYAVGVNFAETIDNQSKYNFDKAVIVRAIEDYFADKQILDSNQALEVLTDYFSVRQPAEAKAEAAAYGDTVGRNNPYIKETESGLLYQIIDSGDSEKRVTDDSQSVRVHYTVALRDGTVVDSSREQGQAPTMVVSNVVEGLAQGIKLIGKGGQIKLWISPELGYGDNGAGPAIGPHQWLIMDVELLEIVDSLEFEELK